MYLFFRKLKWLWLIGNSISCRPILSVIILLINKLDSHFVVLLPLLIHHLSDILFSVTSGLHSVNDIIIADPVSTDTSLTSTTCQGTYPNFVLFCKIISLWIVCNKDLKQTTIATATKAWPNKRFNEDTSSSVCMF